MHNKTHAVLSELEGGSDYMRKVDLGWHALPINTIQNITKP